MYRWVIFDLDGTLLNTLEDLADAANWVCHRRGWPVHTLDEVRYMVGNGIPKLVERFTPPEHRDEETLKEVLKEFSARYDAHKEDKTAPYPGMVQLLARLKEEGIVTAVLSNKADALAGPVVERYYPGLFSIVQGALPGVSVKPDPALLRLLMQRLDADEKQTLFVGDSDVDVRTAKNGGLPGCGVLWGFREQEELEEAGADFLVSEPEQLYALITAKDGKG